MRYSLLSFLFTLLLCTVASAQPIGPAQPVILDHADSLLGYQLNGEEIQEFIGHVSGMQGVVQIQADRAILYSASNRAVLTGRVKIAQPDMTILAPRVEYEGATRIATTPSGVTLLDGGATLTAGSGRYFMYERKAEFQNGVKLQDGKSTLRAGAGDYYSLDRRAVFTGGVRVDNDSGTITARDLTYWRDTRETYAVGNVVVVATRQSATLTGDTVRHRPAEGYTYAVGSPRLVQIDTVRTNDSSGSTKLDTTVITALKLEAFRSGNTEYVATDSVRFRRGKLEALAALARFLPDANVIALGPGTLKGKDSVGGKSTPPDTTSDSTGGNGSAVTGVTKHSGKVSGPYPVVWYDKSQLTGDTITIGLLEKKLRSIDVLGNAFAVTAGKVPERYDQLAGVRLFFDVLLDTIRRVRSEGQASSIYFIYDKDAASGVNRASGDTIAVAFDNGEPSTIAIIGKRAHAEGEYFPEQMVAGEERAFRLDGFRWYGRDSSVSSLKGTLPKAPTIPDVKAPLDDSGRQVIPSGSR